MKQLRLYLIIIIPLLAGIIALLYLGNGSHIVVQSEAARNNPFSLMAMLQGAFHNPIATVLLQR
jgi:hypothetical protein